MSTHTKEISKCVVFAGVLVFKNIKINNYENFFFIILTTTTSTWKKSTVPTNNKRKKERDSNKNIERKE
jgi:hypothetical protein